MEYSWTTPSPLGIESPYSYTSDVGDIQFATTSSIPRCSFNVLKQTLKDKTGQYLIVYLHPGQSIVFVGGVYVSVKKGLCSSLDYILRPSTEYLPVISPAWEPAITIDALESSENEIAEDPDKSIESLYISDSDSWEVIVVLKAGSQDKNDSIENCTIPGCFLVPSKEEDFESIACERNIGKLCHKNRFNLDLWRSDLDTIFSTTLQEFTSFLACGPKGTGKSTIQKIIINRLLNRFKQVVYIDTDLGQPEFSIEGYVSLYILEQPILHPPLSYLSKPYKCIYLGNNTPEDLPNQYLRAVFTLYQVYLQEFPDHPLLVNTAGWIQGLGYELLLDIYKYIKPNYTLCLGTRDNSNSYSLPPINERCTIVPLSGYVSDSTTFTKASIKRDYKFISNLYATPPLVAPKMTTLNSITSTILYKYLKTYKIDYRKLVLYCGEVSPSLFHKSISGCIVGLSIYTDPIPEQNLYPYLLSSLPVIESKGYGIVRAIDLRNHWIYISSTISIEDMQIVNCLIKGNRMLTYENVRDDSILTSVPYFSSRSSGKGTLPSKSRNNIKRF